MSPGKPGARALGGVGSPLCTRGDVNKWLPGGELTGKSRLVQSILAANDTIELAGHGLETDDALTLSPTESGTLPAPLQPDTIYYAIRLTNNAFKLAAAPAGNAIDLTEDGVSVSVVTEPPYDMVIDYVSRWAEGFIPAHAVPIRVDQTVPAGPSNTPSEVRFLVAELCAKMLQNLDGKSSAIVDARFAEGEKQLARYAAGLPVRSAPQAPRANLAITSSGPRDSRGWGSRCLP